MKKGKQSPHRTESALPHPNPCPQSLQGCLTATGLRHRLPREGGHLAGLHLIQPGIIRVWKTLNPTPGSCQQRVQHQHCDSFWLGTSPGDFSVGETETALVCLQQPRHSHSLPRPVGLCGLGAGLNELLLLGMCLQGHSMPLYPNLFCI